MFQCISRITGNAGYVISSEFGRVLQLRDRTGCATAPATSPVFDRKRFTIVVYAKITKGSITDDWVYLFSLRSKNRDIQVLVNKQSRQMEFIYGDRNVDVFHHPTADIFKENGWQIFAAAYDFNQNKATLFVNGLGVTVSPYGRQSFFDPRVKEMFFGSYETRLLIFTGPIANVAVYSHLMTGEELVKGLSNQIRALLTKPINLHRTSKSTVIMGTRYTTLSTRSSLECATFLQAARLECATFLQAARCRNTGAICTDFIFNTFTGVCELNKDSLEKDQNVTLVREDHIDRFIFFMKINHSKFKT
ncbi:uncharacterized protein LOC135494019 [Lineus longissimus]|uniref:uncharacterized protein LOC135494019 n=1 Tax=Lineus longissimus TaxID=88925 RepID=UPI002B4CDD68